MPSLQSAQSALKNKAVNRTNLSPLNVFLSITSINPILSIIWPSTDTLHNVYKSTITYQHPCRNPSNMPNLVGCRDASPPPSAVDQARHNTLIDMQMEALGLTRRDFLSTRDFKENRATFVPVADLESRRLVNTGSIGSAQKAKLEGWNSKTAYANCSINRPMVC